MPTFSSLPFWFFFVAFLTLYALFRTSWRIGMLCYVIAFGLLFLWLANGWLFLLLPFAALVAWVTGSVLTDTLPKACASSSSVGTTTSSASASSLARKSSFLRRLVLIAAILVVLLPLLYFKYTHFLLSTVNALLSSHLSFHELALPVGISFFTFQAISYLVDVYRGRFVMRVTFLEFLFYLTFFPLLLAGPITRASVLLPQIRRTTRPVSRHVLYVGVWLLMLGVLKKCVVADYVAQYNDWIFADPTAYSGFECLMGIIGYSVQIYCDFSGYSDLSIGIAAMMGFWLPDNFSFPYRAHNLSQFWRRWHISLSTWFRDYLYIPMGGNRCSRARTYINNIVTMLIAGLWHGASWMFVLWGGLHAVGLVVQKACEPRLRRLPRRRAVRLLSVAVTFGFLLITWVFFRADSVHVALLLLRHAIADFDIAYFMPFVLARPWWFALVVIVLLSQALPSRSYSRMQALYVCLPWFFKAILFFAVLQLMLYFRTSSVQPFIYAQF